MRGSARRVTSALGQAKGEWATFVDGDDILPPNAFETLSPARENGSI
ncbi:MAG: hypothetical protein V8Q79_03835 [Christensenellales bacterium]